MPRSVDGPRPERDRIQAYLTPEQIAELNRIRGKFLTESGKDIRTTEVFRAAIDHFTKLNWTEIRKHLDAQAGGRSRRTKS